MKIVILSGGSGNDSLIKGLNRLLKYDDNVDIDVIVNAYDNGKSTGVCRAVTDTLGVSDIRKNHYRMYEAIYGDKANLNLVEFYGNRYDFDEGKEEEQICTLLKKWEMPEYEPYVQRFFQNIKAKDYKYKDFSVSNIVYAQMYKEIGYEKTNKHFCDRMGIKDFVVLNSFDNLFIKAQTESGHIIDDEGVTVFWNNPDDKIVKTIYDVKTHVGLNPRAIELVKNADLLVISTGTFWSSIQPTIEYLDFYKYINASNAKKIWVINNEEDGDSFGVLSTDFVRLMEQTGLNLGDFSILVNSDARESLRQKDEKHNFIEKSMGNMKGKHDGDKYARALLQIYFDLEDVSAYDKILLDFDDTIWSRDDTPLQKSISLENMTIVNDDIADRAVIISGNSFDSIKEKLSKNFGKDLEKLQVDIWADANSTLFKGNRAVDFIEDLAIDEKAKSLIEEIVEQFDLPLQTIGKKVVNYKIKPLSNLERKLLVEIFKLKNIDSIKASITGRTTVDILNLKNDKEVVLKHCGLDNKKTLFIGDELDCGNDVNIAKKCSKIVSVANVKETNVILKLIVGS